MYVCMHVCICMHVYVYVCAYVRMTLSPRSPSFERNHHLTEVPVGHYTQYENILIVRIESCYLLRDYLLLPNPAQGGAGEAIQVLKSCGFGVWDYGVWH